MATKDETDDIKEQFEVLRGDVNKLVSTLTGTVAAKKDRTVEELSAEIERYSALAKDRVGEAHANLEERIVRNPLQSILVAIGLGFLIGAMTRR